MKSNPLFCAFILGFFGVGPVFGDASASDAALAPKWTITPTVASQYLFRGARLAGPSFQPDVRCDAGDLSIGMWSSFPLRDKVPGQSDPEIDPYGSYRIALGNDLSLQPGLTVYTFPRAEPRNGFYRLTVEPNLALNYTLRGLTLSPKLYYDVVLHGPTYELNAAYALPVRQIGSELDFYATIGTYEWKSAIEDAAPEIKGRGDYWSVNAALPFQVSARLRQGLE